MRSLIRRAVVAAGVTALVLGASAGAAAASTTALRPLAFTPSGHNFGPVTVGRTAQQKFTLKNNSSTTSSRLTVGLAGSARFSITADTCAGIRLQPGKTCTVTVRFAPTVTGTVTGTLKAAGTSRAATASLTGTGGGYLYWSNYQNGTINRANLDGTGATTLVTGQNYPVAMAVDSSHIYWADYFGGHTVSEANLNGTGVTTLVSGANYAVGVAVDSSHVYWSYAIDPSGQNNSGTINEVPLAGGNATTLLSEQNPEQLAVDGSHIYFVNYNTGTIDEANLDGTGVTTLVSGQTDPIAVAVDSSHIYWANYNGTINSAPLTGGTATTLVTGQSDPAAVAVYGGRLYWANLGNGTIDEANLNGTGVTTLVSGQAGPQGLAISPS